MLAGPAEGGSTSPARPQPCAGSTEHTSRRACWHWPSGWPGGGRSLRPGMGDGGAEARHRAKVYCLNEDGQWDDRGTGHAAVQYLPVRLPGPVPRPAPLRPRPAARGASSRHRAPPLAVRQPAAGPSARAASAPCCWSSSELVSRAPDARRARQAEEAAFIVVLSEDDGASHLLQARVLMEDIYQRQQGTPAPCPLGAPAAAHLRAAAVPPASHRTACPASRRHHRLVERAGDRRRLCAELPRP